MNCSIRKILFALIILSSQLHATAPAKAQEAKYWIDQELDKCTSMWATRTHTAMAYSPIRLTYCASSGLSKQRAEKEAIRGCMRLLVNKDRKAMPCKIIYSSGMVTDLSAFKTERRDVRIPMDFEIYDGVSGTKEIRSGYIVIGKSVRPIKSENYPGSGWDRSGRANATPRRPVSINIGSSRKICDGFIDTSDWYSGNAKVGYAIANFGVTCFGLSHFVAKNVQKAGLFKDGSRFLTFFEPIFEFDNSYIKATVR